MLVKNGTAFIGGRFARADVRVENGKIAQIGDLQPREGEDVRSAAGLLCCRALWISTSTPTRARTACAGRTDVRRMSEGLLEDGRGGVRADDDERADPEATHRALLRAFRRVKDHPCGQGAAVLGAHMEAPFLCPKNIRARSWSECLMNCRRSRRMKP